MEEGKEMTSLDTLPALTRRTLLTSAGALALAAGTPPWNQALAGEREYVEPPELVSSKGRLEVTINVCYQTYALDGHTATLRSYLVQGAAMGPAGPTLRLTAGDTLVITLNNLLPATPTRCPSATCGGSIAAMPEHGEAPTCFNVTNLHLHGVHVSPDEDNILIPVPPGGSHTYTYHIPEDHPAGTYFYHAHEHGSVAIQVASGMAGALIIEGKAGNPWPKGAREQVLIFTSQCLDAEGRCESFDTLAKNGPTYLAGQLRPLVALDKRHPQLFHMVNATHDRFLRLQLEGYRMDALCLDGTPLAKPKTEIKTLLLAPGNRADVLVHPGEAGKKGVLITEGWSGWPVPPAGTELAVVETFPPLVEDRARHAGAAGPVAAARPSLKIEDAGTRRRVTFGMIGTQPSWSFTVNGETFENLPTMTAALGSVELWEIVNQTGEPHPFHIHINPFQVIGISDKSVDDGTWLDTVTVPPAGWVRFLTRFENFAGTFVFHCHTLAHEDLGMMQLFQVTPRPA